MNGRQATALAALLLGVTLLGSAHAHDTQAAGNVQVTLSTDADDALSTSAPTDLQFTFLHAGAALGACRCRVLLYPGTPSARRPPLQDLQLGPLQQGSGHVRLAPVPAGGYTLVLVGRPVQFGDFDAFKMQYVLPAP